MSSFRVSPPWCFSKVTLVAFLVLAACGGDDGTNSTGVATEDDVRFTCAWACDSAERCDQPPPAANCTDACIASARPTLYPHAFVRALGECYEEAACTIDCWEQAVHFGETTSAVATCQNTASRCASLEIECRYLPAYLASSQAAIGSCLELPCDDIAQCQAFAEYASDTSFSAF